MKACAIWKFSASITTALVLFGCASPPKRVALTSKFDAADAQRLLAKGTNSLRGSALIRQSGGGVVTCAGGVVNLVPATDYAVERIRAIYGNDQHGYQPYFVRTNFENETFEYRSLTKTGRCDAQGFLKFDQLADGSFFAITQIMWKVGDSGQGGNLMHRVTVVGGEAVEIVLTP